MANRTEQLASSDDAPSTVSSMSQSQSSQEYERTRSPGAPPYAVNSSQGGANHNSGAAPPGYQSQDAIDQHLQQPSHPVDASLAYNTESLPHQPTIAERLHGPTAAAAAVAQGRTQPPRIAVTDPLADMRIRNLDRPEGLGANSDWPDRERERERNASSPQHATAYPPLSHSGPPSGARTPRFQGVPYNPSPTELPSIVQQLHQQQQRESPSPNPQRPGFSRRESEASSDGADHDGMDDDDFNWSDDEAVEEAAKFEEDIAQQRKAKLGRLSLYAILRFLAVTFLGNLIISCLLIIPVIVIQFVYRPQQAVSEDDATHRDFVADNIQAWFIWAAFNLHIMWWLHFLVSLVPRVGVSLVALIWGTANQQVKSAAEFYSAIKMYISPVAYVAMLWGSWAIIFNSIYGLYSHTNPATESRARYLYRIYQVVQFFFFLTLTVCAEKILIKVIAMRFHKSAYAERIEKVTAALRVFDRLKDYRPKIRESGMGLRSFGYGGYGGGSGGGTPMMFSNSKQGGASARPSADLNRGDAPAGNNSPKSGFAQLGGKKTHANKRSTQPIPSHIALDRDNQIAAGAAPGSRAPSTAGDTFTGVGGRFKSRVAGMPRRAFRNGASTFRTTASRASKIARVALTDPFSLLSSKAVGVGADVNSPQAAKRLAKTIFRSFRGNHRRTYLIPSDFEPAYATVEEARTAFAVFDRDGNGDISQSEIKNTVMQTYKERRALSRSMQDVNHAVGQLESIFYIVVFIIVMFEAFAIFNVNVGKTLTTFYTLGIAFAFIFKESAQNVFDSIIFLFVTHPFDTGDRIAIKAGTQTMVMAVKRMSLLSTEFTITDGTDMYVANAVLADLMITNYRRSGYQWEAATLQIAFDTPLSKLDAVENDMKHWLSTEPERMFEPSTAIVPQKIEYMRSIEVTIGMTHRRTWQDWGMRWQCRNAFVAALCYYLKKHGIRYANPNQPIIYWTEDAAALPPSYNDARGGRRPSDASEQILSPYDDSFDPTPPASPGLSPLGEEEERALPPPKPKTFMGFTPPPDELEGSGLRRRKARAKNKGVTTQGGD